MELKRILAKDLRRATEKAVALYGKDVLFVSNAKVNGMTEVIVAVDLRTRTRWERAASWAMRSASTKCSSNLSKQREQCA
jgi:flagellar biosynthesis GTPase FlhF